MRRPQLRVPRASLPVALAGAIVATAGTGAAAVGHSVLGPRPVALHHSSAQPALTAAAPVPQTTDAAASRSTVGSTRAAALPTRVPTPRRLVTATVLVTSSTPLTSRQVSRIRHLPGVTALASVATGRVNVDGHGANVLGVDPAGFRPWTPKLTAASQPLWQSIASGEVTASFDMGNNAKLPLGATVPVALAGHPAVPMRLGAFASVGMSGVDAVMSTARARELGLRPGTGLLVSVPKGDPVAAQAAVRDVVGSHARTVLLHRVVVIRDAGSYLTRVQINTVLQAAATRVGKPYVWGATGPDTFDCSGLVLWSFAKIGIAMPRVSQQQWFAGPHVPYSDARPGDLLFWTYDPTDPANVDHVAIYAGNGMMLVAPHTGDWVSYKPVPLAHLAGVVRVNPAMAAAAR